MPQISSGMSLIKLPWRSIDSMPSRLANKLEGSAPTRLLLLRSIERIVDWSLPQQTPRHDVHDAEAHDALPSFQPQ